MTADRRPASPQCKGIPDGYNVNMRRKVGIISIVAALAIALGAVMYDSHHYSQDLDRYSSCLSHMKSIGVELRNRADWKMGGDDRMSIADAVRLLILDGDLSPDQIACACSKTPFRFVETVDCLAEDDSDRRIIAFELPESHHRSASTLVLYSNGKIENVTRDEFRKLGLTTPMISPYPLPSGCIDRAH